MIIYISDALNEMRKCLMVYDEFECSAYLSKKYGTWFLRINDNVATSILEEASRDCTQIESSFFYCLFCLGSQCDLDLSEVSVKYIIDCLDRLKIDQNIRNTLKDMLSRALELHSGIVCSSV